MEEFGWGVVGCGLIARNRIIPGLQQARGAKLVGLMDVDPSSVEAAARAYVPEFHTTNLDALLGMPDIQAVYLATPVGTHRECTIRAAAAGKHILCEKPMALTLEDCTTMEQACAAAGVKLQIGFMMRFHPIHARVKQMIEQGELGEIIQGRAQLSHYRVEWNSDGTRNWRQMRDVSGGGALMDMGIHCVDLLRWWLGEVCEVTAMTATLANDYDVEDTALLLMRSQSGAILSVDSTFAAKGAKHVFEIYGTCGSVRGENTISQLAEGTARLVLETGEEELDYEPINLYAAEIEHIQQCIDSGEDPLVGARDGKRNLEVCQAAYLSQSTGRTVTLSL